jgi:hypothetical protein
MNTIKQEAERILDKHVECTCIEAYKSRDMADPSCGRCNWYEAIIDAMKEYAQPLPSMRQDLAKKLLAIRDEFAKEDYNEAYHILYSIANPGFDSYEPWEYLEKIAAGESTEGEDACDAVGFAEWINASDYEFNGEMWYLHGVGNGIKSAELYQLYKQSKQVKP